MGKINVGKDFSEDPIGRYRSDSDSSGQAFREDFLKPALDKLKPGEKLEIILDDGVEAYGSSFLVEGFAGLVNYGYYSKEDLLGKLAFTFSDEDFEFYKDKIIEYINESRFKSKTK